MTKMNHLLRNIVLHVAMIFVVGFLSYANTFDAPFHFDDEKYIVKNPMIKDLNSLLDPFAADRTAVEGDVAATRVSRLVGYASFLLNYKAQELSVTGYHAVNLIIHMINALLLYLLIVLTFKTPFMMRSSLKDYSRHVALISALIFISHPVQTEAVTYISQRFTSLATMFSLISFVCYIAFRLSWRGLSHYILYGICIGSMLLAMLTKEISFTLPIVIALYEVLFFKGPAKKRLLFLVPLMLTMLIIPICVVDLDSPISESLSGGQCTQRTISHNDYFITQLRVFSTYMRLLAFPVSQNLDYDYPVFNSVFAPAVMGSLLMISGFVLTGLWFFRRSQSGMSDARLICFGMFWFFITLSVESTIIVLADFIFEHRLYLPSIGIIMAAVSGLFLLTLNIKQRNVLIGILVTVPLIFSVASFVRNETWSSAVKLWQDVVSKSPKKSRGYINLGGAYWAEGNVDKAHEMYSAALELPPVYAQPHNNLALIYKSQGLTDKALTHYQLALEIEPALETTHNNMGIIYFNEGNVGKAIEHYKKALTIRPDYTDAHNNLGLAYRERGNVGPAKHHLTAALQLSPDDERVHYNLGLLYLDEGFMDKAREMMERALELDPEYLSARQVLEDIRNEAEFSN